MGNVCIYQTKKALFMLTKELNTTIHQPLIIVDFYYVKVRRRGRQKKIWLVSDNNRRLKIIA